MLHNELPLFDEKKTDLNNMSAKISFRTNFRKKARNTYLNKVNISELINFLII